jgi:ubiquinol-cytochrome c reductase cytochrome b subunit
LAFVFAIQVITGVLLMTAYSPGDVSAWGSVYFIQYEMDFGWLIRGLHHFGSQTMVVLLALHMLQVVIAGAHLPPREVNWWLGIGLLSATLGLSLTGYLLPWDQKGFFATQVATNIAGSLPGIGESAQRFLVGDSTYGNHTLTRFFTLHVWILPISMIVMIVLHLVAFRRHGVTTPANTQGTGWFWPDQAFRDLIVCLVIFGIMLSLVVFGGHGTKIDAPAAEAGKEASLYERWAHAGKEGRGANLDAPADPDTQGYPARPEWYFLFLFQLLKYFEGPKILIGTVVIPNGAFVLLAILPLLGYGRMRKFGHYFGILVVGGLLLGAAALTILAMADDSPTPYPMGLGGGTEKAKDLAKKFAKAEGEAKRAVQLASAGIPPEGSREMVRKDPLFRGSKLFESNCAVCHSYAPTDAKDPIWFFDPKAKYKASDLRGYASEKWIRGLLSNPGDDKYFGRTELTGMKNWRAKLEKKRERDKWDEAKKAEQEAEFDLVAKFLAQQKKPKKEQDEAIEKKGLEAFGEHCANCHKFGKEGGEQGPDLTGYGTADWLRLMVMAPDHYVRFGKKNTMPAFRNLEGPGGEVAKFEFSQLYNKKDDDKREPQVQHLSDVDREMIIRFLTGDLRVVFGGAPIK